MTSPYYETVSLRDVMSIIRSAQRTALLTAREEYMLDNPEYVKAMDRELQLNLGNAIAKEIQPSFPTFTRDERRFKQRSIETWVLTRDQVDAIMFTLTKLAEILKTYEVRIPVYGDLDYAPSIIAKGS